MDDDNTGTVGAGTDSGAPYTVDAPVSELIARAGERAVTVVRGIEDTRLDDPTPCADYDVRALLGHLYRVAAQFQGMAAKREVDFSSPAPDYLVGDWRSGFAKETGALVAAWAAPGAEEGTAGAMNLPARTTGAMALADLTVHAWDLARATRQEYTADPVGVEVLLGFAAQFAPTGRRMGAFGEEVPVPAGAPALDRLLGAMGREPRWRP